MNEKSGKQHKRISSKKKTDKMETPPNEKEIATGNVEINPAELKELEEAIQESFKRFAVQQKKSPRKIEMEALESVISDFLQDFIIIGHNVDGSRVVITKANDQKSWDALMKHFISTFMRIMNQSGEGWMI